MITIADQEITGDSSTDSTSAITQLLAALPASRDTKARIVLSGDLLISNTISIPDYTILDLTKGKVKLANSSNVRMFSMGNGSTPNRHIEIKGGEIDGNRANQTAGEGIRIYFGEDILITDTFIHDAKEQNIRVMGACKRIKVKGVIATDGGAGNIYFLQATNPPQLEIVDSSMEDVIAYYTFAAPNCANIGLENCRNLFIDHFHLYGAADFGFHVEEHLYDSIISNGIIHDHAQDGFRMAYSTGNLFSNLLTHHNGRRGVSLAQAADDNDWIAIKAHDNGWGGIVFEDCRYNLITASQANNNNKLLHATYNSGFQILSVGAYAALYNTIRGCCATDTQATKTQQFGLSEGGVGSDFNLMEDNDVRGNAQAVNINRASWGKNKSKTRRNLGGYNLHTFDSNDATPSVAIDIGLYQTNNNTPTIISMFDDGDFGQVIRVVINDAFTTFDFTGTHLKGNSNVDWSPSSGDWLEAVFNGTNWSCAIHDVT